MVATARCGDDEVMKHLAAALFAMVVGVGAAAADGRGTLVVPVVGEHGVAVYCTRNLTPASAAPIDGGGYRVTGLAHGRYVVRLELPHERIDMIAVVPAEGEAIVPPVVARGRCRSIEVVARTAGTDGDGDGDGWSLRYDRSYSARGAFRKAEVNWAPRSRPAAVKRF